MTIKYSKARSEAAIILNISAHVDGFEDPQTFVLTYNPTNLTPNTTYIMPATEHLSEDEVSSIARRRGVEPRKQTLSLTLIQPCPMQYPPSAKCIAPKPGHKDQFHWLRDLARSTKVFITFDESRVNKDHRGLLYTLIHYTDTLKDIPATNYSRSRRKQGDWTVFSPIEDDVVAPPAYAAVPAKRRRAASPSPPLQSLNPKNAPASPGSVLALAWPEAAGLTPLMGSPTEKATTTTLSPSPKLESSPYRNTPDLANVVETMLQKLIPEMLTRFLAVPSTSLSLKSNAAASPFSSLDSNNTATASLAAYVTGLHAAAVRQFHVDTLQKIQDEVLDEARNTRDLADIEFGEQVEDHQYEMKQIKEDGQEEMQTACDRQIENLMTRANEVVQEAVQGLEEQADAVYSDALGSIADLVNDKERTSLQRMRVMLAQEMDAFKAERGKRRNETRASSEPL